MRVIEHQDEIKASPEAVFALMSHVEAFADYSRAIETIVGLGDGRYRWRLRIAGVPLRFDIELTDLKPPERFAWRSLSGVPNRGCFRLMPIEGGTRIHLTLAYRLDNPLAARLVNRAAKPFLRRLSRDIIRQVERSLAAPQDDPQR